MASSSNSSKKSGAAGAGGAGRRRVVTRSASKHDHDALQPEEPEVIAPDNSDDDFLDGIEGLDAAGSGLQVFLISAPAPKQPDQLSHESSKRSRKRSRKASKNDVPLSTRQEKEFFDKLNQADRQFYNKQMSCVNKEKRDVGLPMKFLILKSLMTPVVKKNALQRLDSMQSMESHEESYHKLHWWLTGLLEIPFGVYIENMPLLSEERAVFEFTNNAKQVLDRAVFGMTEVKAQILQTLAHWIVNPKSRGNVLALQGPPGVGKTSIVKNGLAKVLQRPFHFVSLGGATDSHYLKGFGYTYSGSSWGKITEILMKSRCMNPIIYFDELDKVSATEYGREIIGVLTHLTDPTQNDHFHDLFFHDIDLDLSRALFVFSFNDETAVHPVLKDRMNVIRVPAYNAEEKFKIAQEYILPRQYAEYNLKPEEVLLEPDQIRYLIQRASQNESGVRDLIRAIEKLFSRINMLRVIRPEILGEYSFVLPELRFPLRLTNELIRHLLQLDRAHSPIPTGMHRDVFFAMYG